MPLSLSPIPSEMCPFLLFFSEIWKTDIERKGFQQLSYIFKPGIFGCWKQISDLKRYNTDTISTDANLAIGDPMQSVVDGHLRIELLDIDWQELPADAIDANR